MRYGASVFRTIESRNVPVLFLFVLEPLLSLGTKGWVAILGNPKVLKTVMCDQ